ncbi:hypothetical protein QR680_011303 [Steinernema hermaphroditum]|uniref:Uncharacterized protein n=1 Tax=Steinernema hermaphroditum TaxID=289476 RepID=A0AA39ITB0_9BILA|nr:hypothetical protein QR680_011303 [Steinernema hermaphroditum]
METVPPIFIEQLLSHLKNFECLTELSGIFGRLGFQWVESAFSHVLTAEGGAIHSRALGWSNFEPITEYFPKYCRLIWMKIVLGGMISSSIIKEALRLQKYATRVMLSVYTNEMDSKTVESLDRLRVTEFGLSSRTSLDKQAWILAKKLIEKRCIEKVEILAALEKKEQVDLLLPLLAQPQFRHFSLTIKTGTYESVLSRIVDFVRTHREDVAGKMVFLDVSTDRNSSDEEKRELENLKTVAKVFKGTFEFLL